MEKELVDQTDQIPVDNNFSLPVNDIPTDKNVNFNIEEGGISSYSASLPEPNLRKKSNFRKAIIAVLCLLPLLLIALFYNFKFYPAPIDGYAIGYSAEQDYQETVKDISSNLPADVTITSNLSSNSVIIMGASKHFRNYTMDSKITFSSGAYVNLHYTTQYGSTLLENYREEVTTGQRLSLLGTKESFEALSIFLKANKISSELTSAGKEYTNDYLEIVKDNPVESKNWIFINDGKNIYVVTFKNNVIITEYTISLGSDSKANNVDKVPSSQLTLGNNSLTIGVTGDINNLKNPVEIIGQAVSDIPIASIMIGDGDEWFKALSKDNTWGKTTINYYANFNLEKGKYTFKSRMFDKDGNLLKVSQNGAYPTLALQFN